MIVYHAVGANIRLRFLIVNGTGVGATGQTPTAVIKRRSDSQYWTGAVWQAGFISIVMTEEDATNLPGSYFVDFNHAVAGSGLDEILVRYTNAAPLAGLDEEQHVFRPYASSLSPDRRLGHALADDGVDLRVSLWIEEAGQRVTDYTSVSAQIKDSTGTLVVNLGTVLSDSTDGVFAFATSIAAVTRNVCYVLAVQAVRGVLTDSYNVGFVRV